MDTKYFLKVVAPMVGELKGESSEPGFIGWIEVLNYSISSRSSGGQPGTGGIGTGQPRERSIETFSVLKYHDQTTPGFFTLATRGFTLDSFTLIAVKAESGGRLTTFLKLEDRRPATLKAGDKSTYVSGIMSAGGASDAPMESISFFLANPVWTYFDGGKSTALPTSGVVKAVMEGAAKGVGSAAGGMMGSGTAGAWKVKKHAPFGTGGPGGGISGLKRPAGKK